MFPKTKQRMTSHMKIPSDPSTGYSSRMKVITPYDLQEETSEDLTEFTDKDDLLNPRTSFVEEPLYILSEQSSNLIEASEIAIPKEIKALLRILPFFTDLAESDDFLDDISQLFRVRKCKPGDVVIRQGETARAMFFILKGILNVISEDGEIYLAELSPGAYCKFRFNSSW